MDAHEHIFQKHILLRLLLVNIVIAGFHLPCCSQSFKPASEIIVHHSEPDTNPLPDIVEELAYDSKTVIGIYGVIASAQDKTAMWRHVTVPQQGTLAELLDNIVAQAPGYRWEQAPNGTIHVIWGNSKPTVLDVSVPEFKIHKLTRQETQEHLHEVPAVSSWMWDNRCRYTSTLMDVVGIFPEIDGGKYSFRVTRATVSALLEVIATKERAYFWKTFEDHTVFWKSMIGDAATQKQYGEELGGNCFLTLKFRQVLNYGTASEFDLPLAPY